MFSLIAAVALQSQSPVYLECALYDGNGGEARYSITVNEADSSATIVNQKNGASSEKLSAAFAPTSVTFRLGPTGGIWTDYVIDRSSLLINSSTRASSKRIPAIVQSGVCKIAAPVARKF